MRRAADAEVLAVLHRHNASPYSAVGNGQLLDRVPEPLRLVHYTRRAIPAEYAASFGYYHRKIGDVHLDGLPEPMQRELMFVVWRIVELGGRVPCGPLGLLARELAATAARLRDQGQPGSSLLDRTPAQWRTELATTWARRTKALRTRTRCARSPDRSTGRASCSGSATTRARGGAARSGTRSWTTGSRDVTTSRSATRSTGTASTRRGCASPRCGSSRRCWRPTACVGPPSRPGTARWSCSAGGSAAVAWTHHCSATTRRSCDR